eukprot:scaffold215802_cov22-Tisochrysis_lutea.AAC.1
MRHEQRQRLRPGRWTQGILLVGDTTPRLTSSRVPSASGERVDQMPPLPISHVCSRSVFLVEEYLPETAR